MFKIRTFKIRRYRVVDANGRQRGRRYLFPADAIRYADLCLGTFQKWEGDGWVSHPDAIAWDR